MNENKFLGRNITTQPIIAICYDFDKTLSPQNMQEYGFIQDTYGKTVDEFWEESNNFAKKHNMDQNLSYMYHMMKHAHGRILFTKKTLLDYGSKISLFSGVENWFNRINKYAEEQGIIVEHYIISSGLKEMIEGTSISKNFKEIYATSFCYDDNGVPFWSAQSVNYTNKTQFLFRISKDVLDINDSDVNSFIPSQDLRIPFRNIIYIGDSDTDIPCMKLVNDKGGYSIGVYNPEASDETKKKKVYQMIKDQRISYYAAADYSEGQKLDILVKTIINKTRFNEQLASISKQNNAEALDHISNDTEKNKRQLIDSLSSTENEEQVLNIFNQLRKLKKWEHNEAIVMLNLAINLPLININIENSIINETYANILQYTEKTDLYYEAVRDLIIRRDTP